MQKILGLIALTAFAGTALGQSVSYSTPYTPGTPDSLQAAWSGLLDGTSPTFRRAGQSANASELTPNAPTALGTAGAYPYQVQSFTPSVSGLYRFFSAQAYDGYLHLYQNAFDPSNALTNVLAGDDDMATLNGGVVPNRNGVPTTNDSGFQFNLNAGTNYFIVTSTFSAAVPANGAFYNEIYGGGTPATPIFNIPDNNATGVSVTLTVPASETGTIQSFDSIDIFNFTHTWIGDLILTLTHVDSGTSVVLMNAEGGTSNSTDLRGDYSIADGGLAWPTTGGTFVAPGGTYATSGSLADFIGLSLAGDWVLTAVDAAGGDLGSLSGFRLNVTVPAPGSAALLGLAGLIAGRRRR